MKYDLNEVAALLTVVKEAAGHPKLKPLVDAAMAQLEAYADEHRPKPPAPVVEEEGEMEDTTTEPGASMPMHPASSHTATIADRNSRRL